MDYTFKTISRKVLSDLHTPVSIYLKVRDVYPKSALLESSDFHGNENSLSYIALCPLASIGINNGECTAVFPDRKSEVTALTGTFNVAEVKIISDYLKPNMPLPQYLPYARFLLNTDLSHTAKLLYTLLLDRATLSQKNNWVDEQGRIYVIYPLSNLAKDLGCCVSSVTRSFAELEKAELAEQVRYGFSTPSHILLKVPHTVQNCAVTVCTSAQHECAETHSMIMQKCTPNQRNKNNLKDNHLIKTTDAYLTFGEYQNVFLTEKEYNQLKADFSGLDDLIEQLSAYIQSTGRKYADHAATLRIWAKRQQSEKKTAPGIPEYTFAEGESL